MIAKKNSLVKQYHKYEKCILLQLTSCEKVMSGIVPCNPVHPVARYMERRFTMPSNSDWPEKYHKGQLLNMVHNNLTNYGNTKKKNFFHASAPGLM